MTFLEGALVTVKSAMHRFAAFLVTEVETVAGVQFTQDMMYVKGVLVGLGLKVKLLMILKINNSGAVNLANN